MIMLKGLRILSGSYRRRAIKLPSELAVRPTLVRARKMVFDILLHQLGKEFSFLDAFAGSGIMGIEALSIGSKKVIFFDNNPKVIRNLQHNLKDLNVGFYSVIKTNTLAPPQGSAMDVIFIDPPYKKISICSDVIKKLKKYNWIGPETLIILESSHRNTPILKQTIKIIKEKRVANSIFRFFYVIDETEQEAKQEIGA